MRTRVIGSCALLWSGLALAQTSANFKLTEQAFNADYNRLIARKYSG